MRADLKIFEVVRMVVANGNFSVEISMNPVSVSAETGAVTNVNAMSVAAIFLSEPEVGHAFKFRDFALNQVAIKFCFGLLPTSTTVGVIKSTLKKQSVADFVSENLPRSFAVIESFGIVRVSGSEDDEGDVIASVPRTPAIITVVGGVERVA